MSRYIDADKVLSKLCLDHKDVIYIDKEAAAKRIKALPHIDIVRCKECKHREKYPCDEIEFYECSHLRLYGTKVGVEDDWFCADGERKDNE